MGVSPFFLEIPEHALQRLKMRKISRHHVRKVIVLGELVEVHDNGRNVRRLKIGSKILEVVYLGRPGGFVLVTCYWLGDYP